MEKEKNNKRVNRGKSGIYHSKLQNTQQSIKPRSAIKNGATGFFQPDLLAINPAPKLGFLFHEHIFHDSYYENRLTNNNLVQIAKQWLKALKNHPDYKQIKLERSDYINDAFNALITETNRLFNKYENWTVLIDPSRNYKCSIYYYNYIQGVSNWLIPLDWFIYNKDEHFKEAGLMLIVELAKKFGVDYIMNDSIDGWIFQYDNDRAYISEWVASHYDIDPEADCYDVEDSETLREIQDEIENIMSYKNGEPARWLENIREMKPLNVNVFTEHLSKIKDKMRSYWLEQGLELLKLPTVKIGAFDLNPSDLNHNDGDPVSLSDSVFFPYSVNDALYNHYDNYLDANAHSFGWGGVYEYGVLSAESHYLLDDSAPLIKFLNFLSKGRYLYFKENPQLCK